MPDQSEWSNFKVCALFPENISSRREPLHPIVIRNFRICDLMESTPWHFLVKTHQKSLRTGSPTATEKKAKFAVTERSKPVEKKKNGKQFSSPPLRIDPLSHVFFMLFTWSPVYRLKIKRPLLQFPVLIYLLLAARVCKFNPTYKHYFLFQNSDEINPTTYLYYS